MKNIIKKESLRTAICLMLVLVMAVTILPENAQAVTVKSGFTMDLVDLKRSGDIKCFGKVGKGGAKFLNTVVEAPEGATVYIEEDFHICSGKYVYQVYYEGRNWAVEAKRIEGLAETARGTAHATYTKRSKKNGIKVKKTALVGDVMDPLHYYFIYAKPKATDKNCIGFVAVGAGIQVINENYNSEWAEILWGNYSVGYIKKDCLNYADGDLAGLELRRQQDVKQAKKAKLTYKGILKDYDKDLKKKEFCRLAVNWYKATGHTLPKQSKKSPYTDTKDPYVIMAHQLGIVKSTSNKKFRPDKMLTNNW